MSMKNEIYRGVVRQPKWDEDPDEEIIILTAEANGHAIWRFTGENGTELIRFRLFESRNVCIEDVVQIVMESRAARDMQS